MRDFLGKRDKGQLLTQRSRRLKETLLRQTELSVSEDGYVHFGHQVMVVNPDFPEPDEPVLSGVLSLCMTPDEIKAHLLDELEVPCGLSAAQARVPMGRNTFVVLSSDGGADGRVLRYGQSFCLGICGCAAGKQLYLSSDHRTLQRSSPRSWLQEVFLTDERSHLSCWQAACPDPQLRLEQEGAPVPVLGDEGPPGPGVRRTLCNCTATSRGFLLLVLLGIYGTAIVVTGGRHWWPLE
ncbi:PREDICTED: uncharacterized protein C15orf26 homolog [Condylura cristata]|uniref:uncharacterized protein C15orf26 homolog n=1 Tax=Condylura cristata TaxID=143302 RepID=UPI0006431999|nr:PREDICTED: uncharacterized protein C15orf26 homolog [Condylura cristata]